MNYYLNQIFVCVQQSSCVTFFPGLLIFQVIKMCIVCVRFFFNTTNTPSTVKSIKSLPNCPLYIVLKLYCNPIWYESMTILCFKCYYTFFFVPNFCHNLLRTHRFENKICPQMTHFRAGQKGRTRNTTLYYEER